MDTLYHGEDTEMEFLDSFLDYDSISIISPDTHHPEVRMEEKEEKEEEETLNYVIEEVGEEGLRRRRAGLKERMQWFASRGKVNMRGLSSSGSLASLQGSLRSSKERLSDMRRGLARSTERINTVFRSKRSVSPTATDHAVPVSPPTTGVTRIQSYEIPVETPKIPG